MCSVLPLRSLGKLGEQSWDSCGGHAVVIQLSHTPEGSCGDPGPQQGPSHRLRCKMFCWARFIQTLVQIIEEYCTFIGRSGVWESCVAASEKHGHRSVPHVSNTQPLLLL